MKLGKKLVVLLATTLLIFSSLAVQATGNHGESDKSNGRRFSDMGEDHWAHDYVQLMADYGIIDGYTDGTFRPDKEVSRAQFAKMMVLTLGLDTFSPSTPSFLDVKKSNWAYKYVETAKSYLTGFQTAEGDLRFKPELDAVREDLAVAIIKGLGINPDGTDLGVLENYKDKDNISINLKKYVAAIINEGIMIGDDNGNFKPQESISRAEAATLLARLIMEEKVTFDEEKVVFDEEDEVNSPKHPQLEYDIREDDVLLEWTPVDEDDFKYYKVVLSKYDSSPAYPENGYAACISGTENNKFEVYNGCSYNSGDFDGTVKAGETYYASITAVYDDEKYTSNVIEIKVPGEYEEEDELSKVPYLEYGINDDGIVLEWNQTEDTGFKYYKVVVSKDDASPSYPDNGYLTYISDVTDTRIVIKEGQDYNDGDIDILKSDEKYYIAITAIYHSGNYTSNVITVEMP